MSDALAATLDDPDAIVGASGAGKSYTGREKVERLFRAKRHTIVFDPTGVWHGLRADAAGTGPGFHIPIFGGPHGDADIRPDQGGTLAGLLLDQSISAILDLSRFDEADLRRFALDFLIPLRHRERANLHLIFDEAEEFAPQTAPDNVGFELVRQMVWIAKRGRVFGLVPTFITQRPADFAKSVLSQVQTLYFHQLIAPADQAPVRAYLKANSDAATLKQVEASLPELERGQRWIYSPRRKILELGRTPPIETFDSMATPAPGEAKREAKMLAGIDVSAIRAALAPVPVLDPVPADPAAAYAAGAEAGLALRQRDERIAELEQLLGEERRRRVRAESRCGGNVAALRTLHKMIEAQLGSERYPDGDPADLDPLPKEAYLHWPDAILNEPDASVAGDHAPRDTGAAGGAASVEAAATNALRGRRALDALAACPEGLTEQQWAWVAQLAIRGGTWSTYRSALVAAGLVEQRDGLWRATTAGLAHAPGPMEIIPLGPDLARAWAKKISSVGRMVEVLIKRWPHFTTRDGLAADLGMSASGGTFGTYLGRLRSAGMLEEQGKRLRLAPEMMEYGR